MPRDLTRLSRSGATVNNLSVIETEALAESASSLGYHGTKVEKALAALKEATTDKRSAALNHAADAVWSYFVQRELCGLRDHRLIIREMGIPGEVLVRLGAVTSKNA
ncbi:hypothetical protein NHF56_04675 [Rhizobium sp. L1K21]|nr:DUF6665 family protein [Rhizobium sp. L1K21]MCO6185511.1 hypothetical protein [Rhizobium sp. L1K21]